MSADKAKKVDVFSRILYTVLVFVPGLLLYYFSDKDLRMDTELHDQNAVNTFVHYHWFWVTIAMVAVAFVFYVYAVRRDKAVLRRALLCLFVMIVGYYLLWCGAVKVLWGRVRFIHLDEANGFTPFYEPNWFSGHHSFPSGHTACIAAWLAPCWALIKSKRRVLGTVLLVLVLAFAGVMAYSRVCYGAHYPTDTLFSLFCACAFLPLAWVVTCWLDDKILPMIQSKWRQWRESRHAAK